MLPLAIDDVASCSGILASFFARGFLRLCVALRRVDDDEDDAIEAAAPCVFFLDSDDPPCEQETVMLPLSPPADDCDESIRAFVRCRFVRPIMSSEAEVRLTPPTSTAGSAAMDADFGPPRGRPDDTEEKSVATDRSCDPNNPTSSSVKSSSLLVSSILFEGKRQFGHVFAPGFSIRCVFRCFDFRCRLQSVAPTLWIRTCFKCSDTSQSFVVKSARKHQHHGAQVPERTGFEAIHGTLSINCLIRY
jgi:hypothetical protein